MLKFSKGAMSSYLLVIVYIFAQVCLYIDTYTVNKTDFIPLRTYLDHNYYKRKKKSGKSSKNVYVKTKMSANPLLVGLTFQNVTMSSFQNFLTFYR